MQGRDTCKKAKKSNNENKLHTPHPSLEDEQVKQIHRLCTIIKKSRVVEKEEKLPAAFQKVRIGCGGAPSHPVLAVPQVSASAVVPGRLLMKKADERTRGVTLDPRFAVLRSGLAC